MRTRSKYAFASWTVWLNLVVLALPYLVKILEDVTTADVLPELWQSVTIQLLALANLILRVVKTKDPVTLRRRRIRDPLGY